MQKDMEIKIERIHKLSGSGPTKAFCDILISGLFIVKGIRIVNGKNGLFVAMPQDQGRDGKWYDTFFPSTRETRKQLEELILASYMEKE